uniref:RING-type E3 ubiquitin transferase n=1 Tax=Fagus sylvatica TaxID=28930 RepID=A0A2N9FI31_FAGSY
MDSIEKGIVELISQGIRKLVMGAAADKHFSKRMMDLKSKKAIYVCLQAPVSCQIQFICKGLLIHTREAGILDGAGVEVRPSQNYKTGPSNSVRSQSVGQHIGVGTTSSGQVSFCGERIASVGSGTDVSSLDDIEELSTPRRSVAEGSSDEWIESSIRYPPGLDYSTSSSSRAVDIARISSVRSEGSENGLGLSTLPQSKENDTLYAQLEKAMAEAENARREVFQEADRRGKAEKDAVEAMHRDQKSSLESQIAESHEMINGLELRIVSAVELFQTYKKERDEFLVERDNALKEAEEPKKKSRRVAIKVLQHHNFQDPSRFQSEVDTLNNLRHPNLVTLIGYCQEVQALIYEYVPYGSLEDRLSCKDNTPPLSWQIQVRIATELCSALIFLHSCKPCTILHGDLTTAKVLLDANFVSKLCDHGNCSLRSHYQSSNNNITQFWRTEPKGSNFAYLDPEFLSTGELTLKSDAYSFGITLLQLLTGKPPWGITKEVQYALDAGKLQDLLDPLAGKLQDLLDPLAGDWPFVLDEELAHLALRCCEMYQKNWPDLGLDVWPVLEPMRALYGDPSLLQLSSKEHSEPPSYFLCPISQPLDLTPLGLRSRFSLLYSLSLTSSTAGELGLCSALLSVSALRVSLLCSR